MRGLALGVATLLNRVTSGLIAVSFLSLSEALTPAVTYYGFAATACAACVFLRQRVPETKGISLEEIERQMAERFMPRGAAVRPEFDTGTREEWDAILRDEDERPGRGPAF